MEYFRAWSRQAAFSVLEIMVAVALLAVIIVGLLAMFYQVQRAFRAGTAQVDVMEGGRAAISTITREMQEVASAGLLNVTNLAIVPSAQGIQTARVLSSGTPQPLNFLNDFCFLQRRNDEWTGVAYRLTNAISGVGTLVRYSWSWPRETNPIWANDTNTLMSGIVCREPPIPPVNIDHSHVLDGVVHFQIEAYDAKGILYRDYPPPLPNDSYLRLDEANEVYAFMSTNLPAYLDLELRVLEPATLAKFRTREQADLLSGGTSRLEYLGRQIGRTHVFRQRISVRTAATLPF